MANTSIKPVPRPEYPRPQFVRDKWINLNGRWQFEIDQGKSGRDRGLYKADTLCNNILVPFCPESRLSGVEYKDFMASVWYMREFDIPEEWANGKVIINFGAVDYDTEVWVNGKSVGKHRGGYTSFSFDITEYLSGGKNIVTVCAEDDVRSGLQPRGKQSSEYFSHGCDYTRTTGIWQTVWLEFVPDTYIVSTKYVPDIKNGCIHIQASFEGCTEGYLFGARVLFDGRDAGSNCILVNGKSCRLTVKLSELHLWEVGNPNLYDLVLTLYKDGGSRDIVKSYFGMRSVTFGKGAVLINGKPVFQRLVLDQGFYPDGIYTAPADEDLKKDIEISMSFGFNGARLHQKVFEPRFLYWADKLGYLVWGEHGNWGLDISKPISLERFLPEWIEAMQRDFSHPSIVGWCPFNETQPDQDDEVIRTVYKVTKSLDNTRPCIDTSGWKHVETDVFDVHDYEQDVEKFADKFASLKNNGEAFITRSPENSYKGQPYFVSEYGGIWWNPGDEKGWGYGQRPESEVEFLERYKGLTETLLNHPKICAFCYTQLYDIEQEVNGLCTYDRKPKFDPAIIKEINSQEAAIEKL